jgi:hypothetical protein
MVGGFHRAKFALENFELLCKASESICTFEGLLFGSIL